MIDFIKQGRSQFNLHASGMSAAWRGPARAGFNSATLFSGASRNDLRCGTAGTHADGVGVKPVALRFHQI
jgi:hypothetical protein